MIPVRPNDPRLKFGSVRLGTTCTEQSRASARLGSALCCAVPPLCSAHTPFFTLDSTKLGPLKPALPTDKPAPSAGSRPDWFLAQSLFRKSRKTTPLEPRSVPALNAAAAPLKAK